MDISGVTSIQVVVEIYITGSAYKLVIKDSKSFGPFWVLALGAVINASGTMIVGFLGSYIVGVTATLVCLILLA